ncbi:hypothetical protein Trydic_g9920 [Trypoxylus dichotomus]
MTDAVRETFAAAGRMSTSKGYDEKMKMEPTPGPSKKSAREGRRPRRRGGNRGPDPPAAGRPAARDRLHDGLPATLGQPLEEEDGKAQGLLGIRREEEAREVIGYGGSLPTRPGRAQPSKG